MTAAPHTGRRESLVSAWQAALSAEHQAVYGYALLGPQLDPDERRAARDFAAAHAALRDATAGALAAAHQTPRAAEADYPGLYPVHGALAARHLATRLETEAAVAWRYLYAVAADDSGATAGAVRSAAQAALTDSAVRATHWRGAPVPFPGI